MKNLSPNLQRGFALFFSITVLSTCIFAQSVTTKTNERKVRYITSNNTKTKTRPRIKVIKRKRISLFPTNTIQNLKKDDNGLEKLAFDLINEKRTEMGLVKLNWNEEIARLARQHSENMAKHSFFSHIGLNGRTIDQRAFDYGIKRWKAIGENIAYNKGISTPAVFAVERWMLSSTHKQNLLDNRWTESGIGVGITEDNTYYFTQIFLVQ